MCRTEHFCYQRILKLYEFEDDAPPELIMKERFVVILGKTGVRIMTAFENDQDSVDGPGYCPKHGVSVPVY